MKYFTEPKGCFVIKIPPEWQYKNIEVGHEEVSPFSFQLYENPVGAFQISCYSVEEKPIPSHVSMQNADTPNLEFLKSRMDGGGFNMHLWHAAVEGHLLMAKYIYDTHRASDPKVLEELNKAEAALATLVVLSESKRQLAIDLYKYENFMASLGASYDLKWRALENKSFIEFLVIVANQIDAFLRMAVVLKKQIDNKSNDVDVSLLFQGENDPAVMERKIYSQAKLLGIISEDNYIELERLYKERNKVIHRYIISDFKTLYLYNIALDYEIICEEVRIKLKNVEDIQFKEGVGIYGGKDPYYEPNDSDKKILYSQVNDKHLIKELKRIIGN